MLGNWHVRCGAGEKLEIASKAYLLLTHGFPSEGGEAVEVKDAIIIMLLFSTFTVALLTYISNNYKRK